MRRSIMVLCAIAMVTCAPPVAAGEDAGPGLGGFSIGVEFGPVVAERLHARADDDGLAVGLSGYGRVGRDWYVGAEYTAAGTASLFGAAGWTLQSAELNAKRVLLANPWLTVALGGGMSYGRLRFDGPVWPSADLPDGEDDLFGAQVIGDVVVGHGAAFFGIKLRYQVTEDVEGAAAALVPDHGGGFPNVRACIQVGIRTPRSEPGEREGLSPRRRI